MSVEIETYRLEDPGLLSDRQAAVYALREIDGRSRAETAELLEISRSTVDDHHRAAARKLDAARETIGLVDVLLEEADR